MSSFSFFWFTWYIFGIGLMISVILFFWMSQKLSKKLKIINLAVHYPLGFLLSTFFLSRFFFWLAEWRDQGKYIFGNFFSYLFHIFQENGLQEFVAFLFSLIFSPGFNLSLAGALLGFFIYLYFKIRHWIFMERRRAIDVYTLSFLFVFIFWFLFAFFGGTIVGIKTTSWMGILYENTGDGVLIPHVPLGIIYSITFLIVFSFLYTLRACIRVPGFSGYLGWIITGCIFLIGEEFNRSQDMFESFLYINILQIMSIFAIILGLLWLLTSRKEEK